MTGFCMMCGLPEPANPVAEPSGWLTPAAVGICYLSAIAGLVAAVGCILVFTGRFVGGGAVLAVAVSGLIITNYLARDRDGCLLLSFMSAVGPVAVGLVLWGLAWLSE
jgi:hypothetical protein